MTEGNLKKLSLWYLECLVVQLDGGVFGTELMELTAEVLTICATPLLGRVDSRGQFSHLTVMEAVVPLLPSTMRCEGKFLAPYWHSYGDI